jgi:hypothetical protein
MPRLGPSSAEECYHRTEKATSLSSSIRLVVETVHPGTGVCRVGFLAAFLIRSSRGTKEQGNTVEYD